MTTDPSVLPQWKDHPVPWVARWSGEEARVHPRIDKDPQGHIWVSYPDGSETREPDTGILWQREGLGRKGEPQFAHVSTYRQRAAMRRRLCQVCGTKIPEGPITWLLSSKQIEKLVDPERIVTMSPPLCDGCVPLALDLCPHLRVPENRRVFIVEEYRIFGVSGEVYMLDRNRNVGRYASAMIGYDEFVGDFTGVLAKQQVVQFTKFTEGEL